MGASAFPPKVDDDKPKLLLPWSSSKDGLGPQPALTHLEIAIAQLEDKDLQALGILPALILKLSTGESVTARPLAITAKHGFQTSNASR